MRCRLVVSWLSSSQRYLSILAALWLLVAWPDRHVHGDGALQCVPMDYADAEDYDGQCAHPDVLHDRLIAWLVANGGRPNLDVAQKIDYGGGNRGYIARRRIASAEVLYEAPLPILMTSDAANYVDSGGRYQYAPGDSYADIRKLAVVILNVKAVIDERTRLTELAHLPFATWRRHWNSAASFWQPFVEYLPTGYPDMPWELPHEHRGFVLDVHPTLFDGATPDDRGEIEFYYRLCLSDRPFCARHDYGSWLWSYYSVVTRSFTVLDPGTHEEVTSMVPFADLFNHGNEWTVWWGRNDLLGWDHWMAAHLTLAEPAYVLVNSKPITAGQPIEVSYGHHGNSHLITSYGFAMPANKFDRLALTVSYTALMDPRGRGDLRTPLMDEIGLERPSAGGEDEGEEGGPDAERSLGAGAARKKGGPASAANRTGTCRVYASMAPHYKAVPTCVDAFRIAHADRKELAQLDASLRPCMSDQPTGPLCGRPVSVRNEKKAWGALLAALEEYARSHPLAYRATIEGWLFGNASSSSSSSPSSSSPTPSSPSPSSSSSSFSSSSSLDPTSCSPSSPASSSSPSCPSSPAGAPAPPLTPALRNVLYAAGGLATTHWAHAELARAVLKLLASHGSTSPVDGGPGTRHAAAYANGGSPSSTNGGSGSSSSSSSSPPLSDKHARTLSSFCGKLSAGRYSWEAPHVAWACDAFESYLLQLATLS